MICFPRLYKNIFKPGVLPLQPFACSYPTSGFPRAFLRSPPPLQQFTSGGGGGGGGEGRGAERRETLGCYNLGKDF